MIKLEFKSKTHEQKHFHMILISFGNKIKDEIKVGMKVGMKDERKR
jgi:hypothetical protein